MARPKSGLSTPVPIQLTKDQHEKLRELSKKLDVSIASLIRQAVQSHYFTST